MKRTLCILLVFLLISGCFTGCSKDTAEPAAEAGNFEPETTAVSGGLTQALEEAQSEPEIVPVADPVIEPVIEAVDVPADTAVQPVADDVQVAEAEITPESADAPEVSEEPASNSHTSISGYSSIGNLGLHFSFSYPANWNNLPGRSTVCFVQPMSQGVTYPARVAVTMKKMAHRGTDSKVRDQFASYFEYLQSQYDPETFEANMALDTKTPFMGNRAMATTYLAYDGDVEIKGYAVCTYFERYMFVFHFLCAYEDFDDFLPAIIFMRDSVRTELKLDDD